ncbi:MAG TPA: NlpC/P60 family protein, partial [Legionellaceae bacterium]|nr:NlpC/P60 family protein [Legionellaceae bacterium]
ITILIPRKNHQHQAVIKKGYLPTAFATRMPLSITPEHMAMILQPLHRRSYGWGGAFFLNDCSQEMKSIFTPFGIWIPRNTTQQMQMEPIEDLSDFNTEARIKTLQEKGHPFMTLIFIGGHVMLYIGTHVWDNQTVAMTYQNVWGLAPQTRDKRYVIGQSVFLPLLEQYPHHPDVVSLASRPLFQLLYLDQMSE